MLFDGKVIINGKCNEMEKKGFVLISTIITLGAKAILIFKKKQKGNMNILINNYIKEIKYENKT